MINTGILFGHIKIKFGTGIFKYNKKNLCDIVVAYHDFYIRFKLPIAYFLFMLTKFDFQFQRTSIARKFDKEIKLQEKILGNF